VRSAGRIRRGRGHDDAGPDDEGQVMLLVIGFVVVLLALLTVVVSATGLHLERKRLLALADLAALAGADEVSETGYFVPGAGRPEEAGPVLDDAGVRARVEDYLADHPDAAAGWDDVQMLEASTPDGRTVTVHLAAVVRPALIGWVTAPWSDGITLDATSTARAW
jgi:hypothetical protein